MKIEWWKYIPGYEGLYMVSNLGRIKSCDRYVKHNCGGLKLIKGGIISLRVKKNGYVQVQLCKEGQVKFYLVHRLVAEAFIPNPDNLPQVNHKNEDKTDNRVENLEWCTALYNISYGSCIKRRSINKMKKINQLTLDGELVKVWASATEVMNVLGFHRGTINSCLRKRRKTAYGYVWRYAV